MKTKITLAILVLVCAVCVSAVPQSKPIQWEYKFAYQCDEGKANKLAADGWELVNMGVTSFNGVAGAHCAFKRPKA